MVDEKNPDPEWKKVWQKAWKGMQKATVLGVQKTQQISQVTRHQVKRSLLHRNRDKLFLELGEFAFHLMEEGKLTHEDLERPFERIKAINQAIREESDQIDELRSETP